MKYGLFILGFIIVLALIIILSLTKYAPKMKEIENGITQSLFTPLSPTDELVLDALRKAGVRTSRDNQSREASERFPYLVAIIAHKHKGFFSCFGCVILTKWVLTAAHCKGSEQSHRVLLYSDYANNRTHTYPVVLWRVHEEFRPNITDPKYDIAVARVDLIGDNAVSRAAAFTSDKVKTVQASVWKTVYTMDKTTYLTNDLEIYSLTLAHPSQCYQSYGITMDWSLICVDMSKHTDCFTTEFGPVFAYNSDRIVGLLTTMRPKDCDSKIAIFTNVSYHRNWILRVTGISYDEGTWLLRMTSSSNGG